MSEETLYHRLREVGYGLAQDLVGRICTVIDATLVDERQAKAAKDLAKGIIWRLQREREEMEVEFLVYHWQNPKLGIIPEWIEKGQKEKS